VEDGSYHDDQCMCVCISTAVPCPLQADEPTERRHMLQSQKTALVALWIGTLSTPTALLTHSATANQVKQVRAVPMLNRRRALPGPLDAMLWGTRTDNFIDYAFHTQGGAVARAGLPVQLTRASAPQRTALYIVTPSSCT
jgi:hypothetical protein